MNAPSGELATDPVRRSRRWGVLTAACFGVASFFVVLHARALPYDFVWMDESEIVREAVIRPPSELHRAVVEPLFGQLDATYAGRTQPFYRPLQVVVASTLHAAFGKRPEVFRAVSLALGAATFAIFTAVAGALLGRPAAAALAGSLAAAHPSGIEVYVWIAGLSEALVDLFAVVALSAYLVHLRAIDARVRRIAGAASIAALVLGLLSKENGAAIPLLAGALGLAEARRTGRTLASALRSPVLLAQLAIAALFLGAWRPWILGSPTGGAGWLEGSPFVQLASVLADWPRSLAWLAAPLRSQTSDSVQVAHELGARAALGVALAVGSAAAAAALLARGRVVSAFGLAWIWLAWLPSAGILPAVHLRAERYLHLSAFGFVLLVADALLVLAAGRARTVLAAALGVAAVAFGAQRTWARLPDWRSSEALFARDVEGDPSYREGRYHLAQIRYAQRRLSEAEALLAPLVRPDASLAGVHGFWFPPTANQLYCHVLVAQNRFAEARAHVETLARTSSSLARDPGIRLCRALAEEGEGRYADAVATLRALLDERVLRDETHARIVLGRALLAAGDAAGARDALDRIDRSAVRDPALEAQLSAVRRRLPPR